jgi:hypothetical protein
MKTKTEQAIKVIKEIFISIFLIAGLVYIIFYFTFINPTKTMKNETNKVKAQGAKANDLDLENLSDEQLLKSGIFEQSGTEVKSNVLAEEFWKDNEDEEVNCKFVGIVPFESSHESGQDEAASLVIYKDGEVIEAIAPQSVLVGRLKRSGPGIYKIIYKGKEKSSKSKNMYMDFQIMLIKKF